MNVLFTSVGRRVELVRAFRAAYDRLGIDGRIVAVDIEPLAPALRFADRPYIVPRLGTPEYVPTLVEICRRERVDAVFPLIDPDIPVLARCRAELEAEGARPAVLDQPAVDITADKWETGKFFRSLGLPTPASWLPGDPALAGQAFPLFLKPRRGSASHNTVRLDTPEHLRFFSGYVPDPVVQEFLPGPEITTDVVCGLDGTVLAIVSRQRIEVRGGEVSKGVTIHDPRITEACTRIARALPARGPITVQCILRGGEPFFTEINARFGGGLPLAIAAGVDAPALMLAHLRGDAAPADLPEYAAGMFVSRFDDSLFLSEADREQLAGRRL